MSESTFTARINQAVRQNPPAYAWKISDRFTAGIPDAYYSGDRADLWVEFKYVKALPKKAAVTPALSSLQRDWLRNQHTRGRNIAVIIGSPEGSIIYPDLTWETPVPTKLHEIHQPKGVAQWIVQQINHAPKPLSPPPPT